MRWSSGAWRMKNVGVTRERKRERRKDVICLVRQLEITLRLLGATAPCRRAARLRGMRPPRFERNCSKKVNTQNDSLGVNIGPGRLVSVKPDVRAARRSSCAPLGDALRPIRVAINLRSTGPGSEVRQSPGESSKVSRRRRGNGGVPARARVGARPRPQRRSAAPIGSIKESRGRE